MTTFGYDVPQNRFKKVVETTEKQKINYYFRDAQGNVLSIYRKSVILPRNETYFFCEEQTLYGSARLGTEQVEHSMRGLVTNDGLTDEITRAREQHGDDWQQRLDEQYEGRFYERLQEAWGNEWSTRLDLVLQGNNDGWLVEQIRNESYTLQVGNKRYELSNHLGNVLAVVSDKKEQSDGAVWSAVVLSATDYFPFGMAMPGRSSGESYKYGFNGQEKDTEIGAGIYTAEFWEYDARLGRRYNLDPVIFPWQSPYATFNNNPIALSDPTGAVAGEPSGGGDPNYDPEKDKGSMMKEVVVTAKRKEGTFSKIAGKATAVIERIKAGAQQVSNNLKGPSITFVAATDAFISDMACLPNSLYKPSDFPGYETEAKRGQSSGHTAAIVAAGLEIVAGDGMMGGGAAVSVSGVGAIGGVPAVVVGAGMTAQGTTALSLATARLLKMMVDDPNDQVHGYDGAGSGNLDNDEIDFSRMSLKELQKFVTQKSGLFRELFGRNDAGAREILDNISNIEIPAGLTRNDLAAYRALIDKVPDPRGTQAIRAEILDHLLSR